MQRVVVLGRGGAGKSVFAHRLAMAIDAPVIELDALFWRRPDLQPLAAPEWCRIQGEIVRQARWVADGDLGPYDVLSMRLRAADTVVLLARYTACGRRPAPHPAPPAGRQRAPAALRSSDGGARRA